MENLFDNAEWVGEFFLPNKYKQRFSGKIVYSPEKGVIFDYTIIGLEVPNEASVLHGVLNTGEKCSLIGRFIPADSGISLKQEISTRHGKCRFQYLIIGDLITHKDLFSSCNFTLTNMQDFFFPKGFKDLVKYSDKPLVNLITSNGELSVGNNATFGFLGKDITTQIFSKNTVALDELQKTFIAIQDKHPDAFFMLKKDITYRIKEKTKEGSDINDILTSILNISNLFAILTFNPVYPEQIQIMKREKDTALTLSVYPSIRLEHRTLELCRHSVSHFRLPIKNTNINLAEVLDVWIKRNKEFSTIVSRIQTETGFRDEHSLYGEIVLYATQFESISYYNGVKDKKYQYPIDTYGIPKISSGILKIFSSVGITDIGVGISDLRNEIAHVGRPKTMLKKMSIIDLIYISMYMHLVIVGYVLSELKIPIDVIKSYIDTFAPEIPNSSSV